MESNRYTLAKDFANDIVRRFGDKIDSVIVYGSVVSGTDTGESDIDILVVTRRDKLLIDDRIHSLVVDFLIKTRELISPIVLSKGEFDRNVDLRTPYIKNVIGGGVILHGK